MSQLESSAPASATREATPNPSFTAASSTPTASATWDSDQDAWFFGESEQSGEHASKIEVPYEKFVHALSGFRFFKMTVRKALEHFLLATDAFSPRASPRLPIDGPLSPKAAARPAEEPEVAATSSSTANAGADTNPSTNAIPDADEDDESGEDDVALVAELDASLDVGTSGLEADAPQPFRHIYQHHSHRRRPKTSPKSSASGKESSGDTAIPGDDKQTANRTNAPDGEANPPTTASPTVPEEEATADDEAKREPDDEEKLESERRSVESACATFSEALSAHEAQPYHQELAAVLMDRAMDMPVSRRRRCRWLLQFLVLSDPNQLVSQSQLAHCFRRLRRRIPDLELDCPEAEAIYNEFLYDAVVHGLLTRTDAGELTEPTVKPEELRQGKATMQDILRDFFDTFDHSEVEKRCHRELRPALHPDFIKRIVSTALDKSLLCHEAASQLVARLGGGGPVSVDNCELGFLSLLQQAEDLQLDIPDLLHRLAVFIARAIADEALPPSFLERLDLGPRDLGSQIVALAAKLLRQDSEYHFLSECWEIQSVTLAGAQRYVDMQQRWEGLRLTPRPLSTTSTSTPTSLQTPTAVPEAELARRRVAAIQTGGDDPTDAMTVAAALVAASTHPAAACGSDGRCGRASNTEEFAPPLTPCYATGVTEPTSAHSVGVKMAGVPLSDDSKMAYTSMRPHVAAAAASNGNGARKP